MNSAIVGVLIGLILIFALLASVVSVITEGISRVLGLRAEYLLRGLRTLFDDTNHFSLNPITRLRKTSVGQANETLRRFLAHPLVSSVGPAPDGGPPKAGNATLNRRERRKLPSYISARVFSRAFLDAVVPDAKGATTLDDLRKYVDRQQLENIKGPRWAKVGEGRALLLLDAALKEGGQDITAVRTALERWYDDHMNRVSGWYKRHVRWISLAIGALLVIGLNLGTVRIASSLYLDQPLRDAVTAQAQKATACDPGTPGDCLTKVRESVAPLTSAGLPIGWTPVEACRGKPSCTWAARYGFVDPHRNGWPDVWHLLGALLGYVTMIVALTPGARFWFDALSRLNSLRSTGPKPAPGPAEPAVVSVSGITR